MWIHEPLQHRESGHWHLCARSDEGGGFIIGCEHPHLTADEAESCLEAQITCGSPADGYLLAKIAYKAYVQQAGGKSLATGQPLPEWQNLSVSIQAAWLATARAVRANVQNEINQRVNEALR